MAHIAWKFGFRGLGVLSGSGPHKAGLFGASLKMGGVGGRGCCRRSHDPQSFEARIMSENLNKDLLQALIHIWRLMAGICSGVVGTVSCKLPTIATPQKRVCFQ